MNDAAIHKFTIFCLVSIRQKSKLSGNEVFDLFQKVQLFDFLTENFEVLHTQSKTYIIEELLDFIRLKNETVSR